MDAVDAVKVGVDLGFASIAIEMVGVDSISVAVVGVVDVVDVDAGSSVRDAIFVVAVVAIFAAGDDGGEHDGCRCGCVRP